MSFAFRHWPHGTRLRCLRSRRINARVTLVACLRNEYFRLEAFLDYYRHLGVGHFMFVDNGSTDGGRQYLLDQPDCSLWATNASYKRSNFGMEWCNYLINRYLVGRWVLCCDPDEFLLYPSSETRKVTDLTAHMDRVGQRSLFCFMVDTYGKAPVSETTLDPGQSPFDAAPFFDATTPSQRVSPDAAWIQGGARMRVNFSTNPEAAPALNKVPLIKWYKGLRYLSSMHATNDPKINYNLFENPNVVSGCIAHFKFTSAVIDKAKEEMHRGEHYDDSAEYRTYLGLDSSIYREGVSERLRSTEQLEALGFMQRGVWF